MRLRTFTASDMPSAMKLVRDALGDDAIILASETSANKKQVTVTAAVEEDDEPEFVRAAIPKPAVSAPARPSKAASAAGDDIRFELQNILRFHNLPELFVSKIMQKATDGDLAQMLASKRSGEELHVAALEKLLARFFVFEPLRFSGHNLRLMLIGTPGIGKTLTIAKLAAKFALEKQPFSVITTDNSRAGGIEQLSAFTSILGVELHVAANRSELAAILKSLPQRQRVLIDTAGCTPYNNKEFQALEQLATIENIEPVLVLPAGGDSLEAIDMVEIFSQLPIRRLLVTRTDTARRFGGILSAAAAHGLAFCNASSAASMNDTLNPLEPALLAQLLMQYKN